MRGTRELIAVAAIILILGACGGDGGSGETVEQETATAGAPQEPSAEQPLSPAEERGRGLFVENCGSCHTLDAAGTQGQIGPDLGDIPLDQGEVVTAIREGGRGSGNMPADLVVGRDAADVAAFVDGSGPGAPGP
jgi:cytochrome c6